MVKKWYKPKGRSAVWMEEEEIAKLIHKRTGGTEESAPKKFKKKSMKKTQEEDEQ